jgi:hypothetical protein
MEIAILMGMGLAGVCLNKEYCNVTPNYYEKLDRLLKQKQMEVNDNKNNNSKSKKIGIEKYNNCVDYPDLVDVSEKINKNSDHVEILDNKPSYLFQFELPRFDSNGPPSAINDTYYTCDKEKLADLERKIAYQEGWSQYKHNDSMTYHAVPEDEIKYENMVPLFSIRNGYGSNDLHSTSVMDHKNELFTGNMDATWKKKKESGPLFAPMPNLGNIYGTPSFTDEEQKRCLTGRYRQNELPFEKIMVTPGLNLDYYENGTHGYHSLFRPMEKTIDELHVKPKVTYEGRMNFGQKGQKRPIQSLFNKYKPDTFKTTSNKDLLPTGGVIEGPKSRDNFLFKSTDRSRQYFEYTGGAYPSQESVGRNVPENLREKYKYSTRQNFLLPKPLQKFSKMETSYNPNLESYQTPSTLKDMTICQEKIGIVSNGTSIYANGMDIPKHTTKEITASQPQNTPYVVSNTMWGIVHNMDTARSTIKETISDHRLNPNAPSLNTIQKTYYSDVPNTTTKETICKPVVPMNAVNNTFAYASLMDNADTTIKETTIQIPYQTAVNLSNQYQGQTHLQDLGRTTTKEIMTQMPHQLLISLTNQQKTPNLLDISRTTTKETVCQTPPQNIISSVNQYQGTPNTFDVGKTTNKETTINSPSHFLITPINQQQLPSNHIDIARTTAREIVSQSLLPITISPIGQQQFARNIDCITKTTSKETLLDIPRNNFIFPSDKQCTANLQDIARTTAREIVSQSLLPITISPIGQQQFAHNIDCITKTTSKETLLDVPRNNFIFPSDKQCTANLQDIARTTSKESTVHVPYQIVITPVDQQQMSKINIPFNVTTKETTIQIPYHTMITPNGQKHYTQNICDVAKTTNKESTCQQTHQTNVAPIEHKCLHVQDIAKTTNKELSNQHPYQSVVVPIGQKCLPNILDIAKTTTKELSACSLDQLMVTPCGQQQRTPNFSDVPKTTSKEISNDKVYPSFVDIINQKQGKTSTYNRIPTKTTNKEITIQIPYHTYMVGHYERMPDPQDTCKTTIKETTINSTNKIQITPINQTLGQKDSYHRIPLRTTVKETTTHNNYTNSVSHSTKGYGYLSENMYAPNTNRQFTCQESYIAPLKGNTKSKSYNEAHNGRVNEKKENLQIYRIPTTCGPSLGPDVNQINMRLKINDILYYDPIPGYICNNQFDRPKIHTSFKTKCNIDPDRFIDPVLLEHLKSNPLNISYNV